MANTRKRAATQIVPNVRNDLYAFAKAFGAKRGAHGDTEIINLALATLMLREEGVGELKPDDPVTISQGDLRLLMGSASLFPGVASALYGRARMMERILMLQREKSKKDPSVKFTKGNEEQLANARMVKAQAKKLHEEYRSLLEKATPDTRRVLEANNGDKWEHAIGDPTVIHP